MNQKLSLTSIVISIIIFIFLPSTRIITAVPLSEVEITKPCNLNSKHRKLKTCTTTEKVLEFRVRWFNEDDEEDDDDDEFDDEDWDVDIENDDDGYVDDFLFTHQEPPKLLFYLNNILIRSFKVETMKFKSNSQKTNDRYLRLNIENMPYGMSVCTIKLESSPVVPGGKKFLLASDTLQFRIIEKFDPTTTNHLTNFHQEEDNNNNNKEEDDGGGDEEENIKNKKIKSSSTTTTGSNNNNAKQLNLKKEKQIPLQFIYPKNNSWISDHTITCYFAQFTKESYDKQQKLIPILEINMKVYEINIKQLVKHNGFHSQPIEGVDISRTSNIKPGIARIYIIKKQKMKKKKKNLSYNNNVKNNNIIHANEIIFYTKTNPRYSVHASVFSIDETKKIIKLANDNGFQDATVGESNSGDGSVAKSIRRTKVSFLQIQNKKTHWIYKRIEQFVSGINNINWRFKLGPSVFSKEGDGYTFGGKHFQQSLLNSKLKNPLCRMMETIQVMKYTGKDHGFYDSHIDSGLFTSTAFRKLSLTIQLSNPSKYIGGNLELMLGTNVETMPTNRGTAVIFPSYILHRVTPVEKGIRFALVTWFRGCESFE